MLFHAIWCYLVLFGAIHRSLVVATCRYVQINQAPGDGCLTVYICCSCVFCAPQVEAAKRDADSAKALRNLLKRDGILPTEILEQSEAAKKAARDIDLGRLFRRVTSMDVAVATRQLSVLLRSARALLCLTSQLSPYQDYIKLLQFPMVANQTTNSDL